MRKILIAAVLRAVVAVFAATVVSACTLGVIGFALLAFYQWITPHMTTPEAAIATAGAALVLAAVLGGLFALVLWLMARSRPANEGRRAGTDAVRNVETALDTVTRQVRGNPRSAVLAAFVVGGVLGACPQLRKELADAVAAALRPSRRPDGTTD